ncbi:limonoid 21-O-acetyltransferse-like isoform X2 [Bidens hawaiensis]|uniref:limonoid 21-O-acetyltransferse-like isoform X2 n=1 Tax=Bidens hawaiensis TaxID=980011 RepID=UPI00404A7A9E
MGIKIQSIQIIKPSKPTPENLRHFKLSFLDQLAPSAYINPIFYYRTTGEVNISDRCDQLANSLSEVLNLYYPLAGRLTEDGLEVDRNDQGVKYLVAQASTSLDDFLKLGPRDQDTTWLVTVQVSVFACGALVIGVSASHHVTDGCNLVRFINQWANMNREGANNGAFAPTFDNLDHMFTPMSNSSPGHSSDPVDQEAVIVTKRFRFNGSSISKLRAKTGSLNGEHSRVTLVTSLIWKALITVDIIKSGSLRDCMLTVAINFRGKASSPVSNSSFGNVWAPYPICFLHNETRSQFGDLVTLIEDTTRKVIAWVQKASGEDICIFAKEGYALVDQELKQKRFCIFTSWCRFPIYEADFGWGKPYWVNEAKGSLEMVSLMDDKNGDGIEAWVSLNQKEMYAFERDQDILDFTS